MASVPDTEQPKYSQGEPRDVWHAKVDTWLLEHLKHGTFRRAVFKLTRNEMIDAFLRAGGTRTNWSTNFEAARALGRRLADNHGLPDPDIQKLDSPWVGFGHVRHLLEDKKML